MFISRLGTTGRLQNHHTPHSVHTGTRITSIPQHDTPAHRKYVSCSLPYTTLLSKESDRGNGKEEIIYKKRVSNPQEEAALLSDSLSTSGRLAMTQNELIQKLLTVNVYVTCIIFTHIGYLILFTVKVRFRVCHVPAAVKLPCCVSSLV